MSPYTLVIDIGGTGIKALVVDAAGEPVTPRERRETPHPARVAPMLQVMTDLAHGKTYDRVSVGFPGVVRQGVIHTAANLHPEWVGVDLPTLLQERFQAPTRVVNDTDLHGYGAIQGKGVELVVALGTGVGSALFYRGTLVPNLELGHHPFRQDKTYEACLGRAALRRDGVRRWNRRLAKAIPLWQSLFNCDVLYLGGGNTKHIRIELPPGVQTIPSTAALRGGIALWRDLDQRI